MTLRPYQAAAVEAVYDHLATRSDNPVVVVPTGGGKTHILSTICRDAVEKWGGRVLVLTHVKELIEQSAGKLRALGLPIGIHSAGLKRRDVAEPVMVAGIQSVWRKAFEFDPWDLVIIDEVHLVPRDGDGMYQEFLRNALLQNPDLRIIGLTATPFRTDSGPICEVGHYLNHVCYEIQIGELIRDGYLSRVVTRSSRTQTDLSAVTIKHGEYHLGKMEAAFDDIVGEACEELVEKTAERRSVLVFCAGKTHAAHVADLLHRLTGEEVGVITADTPADKRADLIARFKGESVDLLPRPQLRWLVNINVLTTGFDAPNTDCVVLLRATVSPVLYSQMVGRGFRLSPETGKEDCLILDFGTNAERHGPVDEIRVRRPGNGNGSAPAKSCPECGLVQPAAVLQCQDCGFEFPPREINHDRETSDAPILKEDLPVSWLEVESVHYSEWKKRDKPDDWPRTLRVDYHCGLAGIVSEWVCVEHDRYAGKQAAKWWRKRSHHPLPESVRDAVALARAGGLAQPMRIEIRETSAYPELVSVELGPVPEVSQEQSKACEICGGRRMELGEDREFRTPMLRCADCSHFIRWVNREEVEDLLKQETICEAF